jgi:polyhydroxyalkanoate synthesis regulator phasin
VKTQLDHLDEKVDHLEVRVDHLGERISQFEVKVTSDLVGLKDTMTTNADECKSEISKLRADVAVLTNSHKYVLWIGGGLATMCMSVFGLCISMLLPSLRW